MKSTSIEEIKKRNEMQCIFSWYRSLVYGVDFVCAVCATPLNLVFMRVSAYFALRDTFCDASKKFGDTLRNLVFMRVSAYSEFL